MKNALLLISALFIAASTEGFAQVPAGPDANPNKRMSCSATGDIRNDAGSCVPIETYLSSGSNKIYWVDQRNGLDSNPGTKSKPWKTVQRANRNGQLTAGDAVIIRSGLYREAIRPTVSGTSGARVTFAAYPGEDVIITGAVPANSGWTLHKGNVYKRPYTLNLSADCPWQDCSALSWRREMLIVSGKLMRQVAELSDINQPGEFYVDGFPPETPPEWMYARFPGDNAPEAFNVEIGREESLFLPDGMTTRTCQGNMSHYRIIGLTFRHAVNARQAGAICSGARGLLLEENVVEFTNAVGVNVAGSNHVLRGNTVASNGQSGIEGGCTECLLEYNESSANNWRLHPRGYNGGGGKFSNTERTVIRYHLAKDNIGRGLWLDKDNYNNLIEKSFFIENEIAGVHLEYRSNYNILRNNVFYGTKWQEWTGSGLLSHAANNNTIVHNSFISNEGIGLWIRANNREPDGYNNIFNNLFINNGTTANVNKAYEIALVTETNKLDGNVYWNHSGLPGPTFLFAATGWQGDDLSTWRSLTGGEKSAQLVSPTAKQVENYSAPSGWRLVANSNAIGKSALLPSGIEEVKTDLENDIRSQPGADVGADEYADEIVDSPEPTEPSPSGHIGEAGSVTIAQSGRDQWHKVNLVNVYSNPVVTMGPLSYSGSHPSTLRVRSVTSTSFEFQIAEWDYLDGQHVEETASYLVVEAGVHVLEDGTIIQAGQTPATSTKTAVDFANPFASTPVVLSQVASATLSTTVATRKADVNALGFSLLLQNQESSSLSGGETVAWIAIGEGRGSTGGKQFEAGTTSAEVDHSWYSVALEQSFSTEPALLASMQTMNGIDPARLRHRNATSSKFEIFVQEEQSLDSEMQHAAEIVGFVAFEPGSISASGSTVADNSSLGETGMLSVRQGSPDEWHQIKFDRAYVDPVVVISQVSYNGPHPSTVRVRNITSTSCEFQLDEWDYLDGVHTSESFSYVVMESGTHTLEDGRIIQAGTSTGALTKKVVSFPQSFASQPIVVSQITSANNSRAAVVRQTDVTKSSFSIFLQPQESVSSLGNESVSWIAMSAGKSSSSGMDYEAGRTGNEVTSGWHTLSLAHSFSSTPVLVAAMLTANGLDVADLRMRNHTASGISVSIEEEQSRDKETSHVAETVGYLAFEAGPINGGSTTLSTTGDGDVVARSDLQATSSDAGDSGVPTDFALHGNYPNPFNPQTTIRYDLPREVHVRLEVFDVIGRRVDLLTDGTQRAGTHEVRFNGADHPSGLYLYRLTAGSFVQTGRMVLLQ